jgi:hypothetical protein
MKTPIFIIISMLFTSVLSAQYLDPTSNWTEIETNHNDSTFKYISHYRLNGDTIFDNQTYFKLYLDDLFHIGIRESESHRVYAYLPHENKEYKIYNFNWGIGDTINYGILRYEIDSLLYIYDIVDKIDSLLLKDNKYYNYVSTGPDSKIIQGIGFTQGFFRLFEFNYPFSSKSEMVCFYKGDQLVYKNPVCADCEGTQTSIDEISKSVTSVKVYPQPSNGSVTFEFPAELVSQIESLSIFRVDGVHVETCVINYEPQIEIKDLKPGLYVYVANTLLHKTYSGIFSVTNSNK